MSTLFMLIGLIKSFKVNTMLKYSLHYLKVSIIIILGFGYGCTQEGTHNQYDEFNAQTLEVEWLYEINDANDDQFLFAGINFVKKLTSGELVVLDIQGKKLHWFDSSGYYLGSGLEEGRGPGEILFLHFGLSVSQMNEIIISDQTQFRLSHFRIDNGELNHLFDTSLDRAVARFHRLNDNEIAIYRSSSASDEDRLDHLMIIDNEGIPVQEEILAFPGNDLIELTMAGAMSATISSPMHAKNEVCFDDYRFIYNRMDQAGFKVYQLPSGELLHQVQFNVPAEEIPEKEKTDFIDGMIERGMGQSGQRANYLSELPQYYPTVNSLQCPEDNTVWLNIRQIDEPSKWLIFSIEGDLIATWINMNEENQRVINVHKGHIFTSSSGDDGSIRLQVYRYNLNDN